MHMQLTNCNILALRYPLSIVHLPLGHSNLTRLSANNTLCSISLAAQIIGKVLSCSIMPSQTIGLITITSIAGVVLAIAGFFFLVQHYRQDDHRISTQRYVDCPSPLRAPRTHDSAIALRDLTSIREASTENPLLLSRPRNNREQNNAQPKTLQNAKET
jgi:hypothetical protein